MRGVSPLLSLSSAQDPTVQRLPILTVRTVEEGMSHCFKDV